MPGRNDNVGKYRFGFNGKENDNEVKGSGNQQDYGFRFYDSRLGRFLSVDPLTKDYPWNSTYAFAENDVIRSIDLEGLERLKVTDRNAELRTASLTITKAIEIVNISQLPTEYSKINASKVRKNFERGNTTLYVKDLPINGKPVDFITKKDWKTGQGYKLTVTYDVTVKVVNPNDISNFEATQSGLPSIVHYSVKPFVDENGKQRTSVGAAAEASRSNNTGVMLNSGFNKSLSPEDVITHEVGIHNMAGVIHEKDSNGNLIYPRFGLESNQPGQIYPTKNETKTIINENAQRGRVDN